MGCEGITRQQNMAQREQPAGSEVKTYCPLVHFRGCHMTKREPNPTLKIELIRYGMTQRQLAEILGVSPAAVSNWVTGWDKPSAAMTRRIAEVLRCRPEDLGLAS
jgi:DNA-binding XRE family transcriptional regulator